MIYYSEVIKIYKPLNAIFFAIVWILPFGLQYGILLTKQGRSWLKKSVSINKRLYRHYKLKTELDLQNLKKQGVEIYE